MIEINLKSFKYLVLFSFCFLFAVLFVKTVYAQDRVILIDGEACIENYATCSDPNDVNFIEALNSGDINVVSQFFSDSVLIGDIRREFGTTANNVCISSTIRNVFNIRRYGARGDDPDIVLYAEDGPGNDDGHWRSCRNGYTPSRTPVSGPGDGWDITGCCPVDYQLVTKESISDPNAANGFSYQNASICAKIPARTRAGEAGYPYRQDGDVVYDINGTRIDYAALGITDPIITDRSSIDGEGRDLGEGSPSIRIEAPNSSARICPSSSDCAIVNVPDGTATPNAATSVELDSDFTVVSPSTLTTATGYSCSRCLEDGQAIAVNGDNLLVCSSSGEKGLVLRTPLVANSVQATLAALRADDTNRPVLERCLEQGGIYIAIGCVDPTPIGIITGLIRLSFGVMGGVALIQLILAGIAYQQGNEEKIKEARNKVLATLTGIAVLVFSVLILRIIGVNILDVIPDGLI